MLCDSCHQKEAVIHMTQVVNGRRSERHLCRDCARKENLINDPFDLWNQEVFAHPFDSFFGNDFVNPFQHAGRTCSLVCHVPIAGRHIRILERMVCLAARSAITSSVPN